MQNVQNAAEIQQRVINLVELYRTKVGGTESENYKAACEYEQAEEQKQIEAQKKKHATTISTSVTLPDNLANKLKVNEQLLGHFYIKVFGVNADERVTNELFANYYDDSVFTKAEEKFLISCFKEMVSYIISTPCNNLSSKDWDEKDIFYIPKEVLDFACEHMHIPDNAIIYNPFAGFAQFATELNNCRFICEDSYSAFREQDNMIDYDYDVSAWTEVVLAANGIENIMYCDDNNMYDAIMSYVPFIPKSYGKESAVIGEKFESYLCSVFLKAYNSLKNHGEMRMILPSETLWKGNSNYAFRTFWETIIKDGSLSEIIQLPHVLSYNCHHDYCLVKIRKQYDSIISIIDARFATRELPNNNVISMKDLLNEGAQKQFLKSGVSMRGINDGEGIYLLAKQGESNFIKVFDINKLIEAETNAGKEPETGLRKVVKIDASELNFDLLIPQIYVIEKPSSDERPAPLSTLCSMVTSRIRDIKYDLSKDTFWIKEKSLAYTYQGAINFESGDIEKADCPNIPPHTDDYVFNVNGELDEELPWSQKTAIGERVVGYRGCYFLDGNKDAVLYKYDKQGVKLGLVRATGKPIAIADDIIVFTPKEPIDALQLYVLLSMPLVYRQIQEIRDFGVNTNLHNVLVPTDRRILIDAEKKASNEESAYKSQKEKLMEMKTEYINEVRMRKHDMGQYIFELVNIEDLMRYYLENRDEEEKFCQKLEILLDNFRSSISELSTLLADLSKEEQFGEPEWFNLDSFLSKLSNRHKADGFNINYSYDESSIKRYNWNHLRINSLEDAMIEAQIRAHDDEMALEDAMIEAQIQAHDDEMALEDAMIEAQIQAHDARYCHLARWQKERGRRLKGFSRYSRAIANCGHCRRQGFQSNRQSRRRCRLLCRQNLDRTGRQRAYSPLRQESVVRELQRGSLF